MIIRFMVFILIFCFQTLLRGQSSPERSDFIILENPASRTIYNVYQQPLTIEQKQNLGTFVPLQVLQENDFLGDGITPVAKGMIGDQVVFIRQDEEKFDLYRRCKIFDDTLSALSRRPGIWRGRLRGKGQRVALEKATRFHRIFEWKRRYYGFVINQSPPLYGWIKKPLASKWRKSKTKIKRLSAELPAVIRSHLRQRMLSANADYRHFFNWINSREGVNLPVPAWVEQQDKNGIKFILEPDSMRNRLARSTAILLEDLRGYLIGSPWKILYEKGVIRVKNQ